MVNDDIQIVRKTVSKGRDFYSEGTYGIADSLKACSDAGYQALFMPELAMARSDAEKYSALWNKWFLTPSVRATGRTKAGNSIVVYAHVPTSLSNPANIRKLIGDNVLVNGAGLMKEDEFYSLIDQDGNGRVFVVDYNTLRSSTNGMIKVDDALRHPQTKPFLGGEKIAEAYLTKHKDVYGKNICVWHSDDLKDSPMARLLCADSYYGLSDYNYLNSSGRFLGVAPEAQCVEKKLEDKPVAQPLEARVSEPNVELLQEGRFARVGGVIYVRAEGLELKQ